MTRRTGALGETVVRIPRGTAATGSARVRGHPEPLHPRSEESRSRAMRCTGPVAFAIARGGDSDLSNERMAVDDALGTRGASRVGDRASTLQLLPTRGFVGIVPPSRPSGPHPARTGRVFGVLLIRRSLVRIQPGRLEGCICVGSWCGFLAVDVDDHVLSRTRVEPTTSLSSATCRAGSPGRVTHSNSSGRTARSHGHVILPARTTTVLANPSPCPSPGVAFAKPARNRGEGS
jgi:hypothetical protein